MTQKIKAYLFIALVACILVVFQYRRVQENNRRERAALELKEKEIRWAQSMIKAPICHYALGYRNQAFEILKKYNVKPNSTVSGPTARVVNEN